MHTAIFPLSIVDSVQRTPQLVVIGCGTGIVLHSFVSERYTAALASRCLWDTSSSYERRVKYKDERNNKIST